VLYNKSGDGRDEAWLFTRPDGLNVGRANKGSRWVSVFGFPKNERSNIDKDEEEALKKLASHLLSLTTQALGKAQRDGELMEVDCDAQN